MEADSEHLGACSACPEQGALPGGIPGFFSIARCPPGWEGERAAVPAGATAESGKERGPSQRRCDRTGPAVPSLPGVAGVAWVLPPSCAMAPLRYQPAVVTATPH